MKLIARLGDTRRANCYLLGPDGGGDSVFIDPAAFDTAVLERIERYGLDIRAVLLTHAHAGHFAGLRTILKLYEPVVYSYLPNVGDITTSPVREGSRIEIGCFSFHVIETPGHTDDSIVYRTGNLLFTGDTLSAGQIGQTSSAVLQRMLLSSVREKILSLPGELMILPGHGPPSTVAIERELNPYLTDSPDESGEDPSTETS